MNCMKKTLTLAPVAIPVWQEVWKKNRLRLKEPRDYFDALTLLGWDITKPATEMIYDPSFNLSESIRVEKVALVSPAGLNIQDTRIRLPHFLMFGFKQKLKKSGDLTLDLCMENRVWPKVMPIYLAMDPIKDLHGIPHIFKIYGNEKKLDAVPCENDTTFYRGQHFILRLDE